jgi:hypothetical protein
MGMIAQSVPLSGSSLLKFYGGDERPGDTATIKV